jgi:S-adenosylmethionine hydrolase
MALITLTTDFGTRDGYAAIMKGVIASISPGTRVIDISHDIDPFNRLAAASVLRDAYLYFPQGSVHIVVVDPGVGSGRAIVALEQGRHLFISPDNGILPAALDVSHCTNLVRVENPAYFQYPVSATFHGRDIFAPVAAHLREGVVLAQLGPAIDPQTLNSFDYYRPYRNEAGELVGTIVRHDRFGNLITDIDRASLQLLKTGGDESICAQVGHHRIEKWGTHYRQGTPNKPFVYVGSNGCLEICINGGSAHQQLGISSGSPVTLTRCG